MQRLQPSQRLAVEQNLPMVGEVIRSLGLVEPSNFYEDCYAAGCLGLCRAALHFGQGSRRFKACARSLIKREIRGVLAAERRQQALKKMTRT